MIQQPYAMREHWDKRVQLVALREQFSKVPIKDKREYTHHLSLLSYTTPALPAQISPPTENLVKSGNPPIDQTTQASVQNNKAIAVISKMKTDLSVRPAKFSEKSSEATRRRNVYHKPEISQRGIRSDVRRP